MKLLKVSNSPIQGRGLLAGEDIAKGRIISRIQGPLVFKINKNKEDALAHPNWVGVRKNIWIDPKPPYKFLNHSCNPTAGMRGITLYALKDIKKGEEITFDYSTSEGDERWEMKCSCGEKNCRKLVRSIQFFPKKRFEALAPYIPAYFRHLYARTQKTKNGDIISLPKTFRVHKWKRNPALSYTYS